MVTQSDLPSRLLDLPKEATEACLALLDAASLVTCRLVRSPVARSLIHRLMMRLGMQED